jgi:hypothetical protein
VQFSAESLSELAERMWYAPRTPRVVELLIAALIAIQALALIYENLLDAPVAMGDTLPMPQVSSGRRIEGAELSTLLAAHLFGDAPAAAAQPVSAAPSAFKLVGLYVPEEGSSGAETVAAAATLGGTDAPAESDFNARFFGDHAVAAARPGAIAWISVSGGPAQRVQVGSDVSGAAVEEIRADGIVLMLSGQRVQVAYPLNPLLAMFRGESTSMTPVFDTDTLPAEWLNGSLRLQPQQSANGVAGFRVYPGSDEAAFERTGLHAGDVIEAIDGYPVSTARDLLPLLSALKDTKPLALRLRRGETPVELKLYSGGARTAGALRKPLLPPGYRPSPTTRPPGASPPQRRVAPRPPPDLSTPPPSALRSFSP